MVEYRQVEGFSAYRMGSDGSIWKRKKDDALVDSKNFGEWNRLNKYTQRSVMVVGDDGVNKNYLVSHLILFAFVGIPTETMICSYRNRKEDDCSAENLLWRTPEEKKNERLFLGINSRKEKENRRIKTMKQKTTKEKSTSNKSGMPSKISDRQALEIRKRVSMAETYCDLAKEYGVSISAIRSIAVGKTFKQVGGLREPVRKRKESHLRTKPRENRVKIEDSHVIKIRELALQGLSFTSLSILYGLNKKEIADIATGKTFSHVTGEIHPGYRTLNKKAMGNADARD